MSPSSSISMLSTLRQSRPLQHLAGYHEWATAWRVPETTAEPPRTRQAANATAVPAWKVDMAILERT
jgi:hypothetical protein